MFNYNFILQILESLFKVCSKHCSLSVLKYNTEENVVEMFLSFEEVKRSPKIAAIYI